MSTRACGPLSVHPRGFGFLDLGEGRSAFVAPPDLGNLLDGDVVEAAIELAEDGRSSATNLKLLERRRQTLFGEVVRRQDRLVLRVDRAVASTDWPLSERAPDDRKLREGCFVVAAIEGRQARALRIVAREAAGRERVLARWSIRSSWPAACVAEAKRGGRLQGPRRDLRALPTITIDAPSTRDIDDALSVIPDAAGGAVRVLVSIADVDAGVPEGSAIDLEARARATSVYLPDAVIPMIPRALSEDRLSLLPEADRAALTAELRIDAEGHVTSVDLYESLIRSDARLSYEAVAACLDQGDLDAVPEITRSTLRWLRAAAARLSVVRSARGGVTILREEAYLQLDERGEPTGLAPRPETSAHRMVERLMVAANEAVACWLHDRGLPGIYRVHPEPEPDRVAALAEFAGNFGFEAGFTDRLTPLGLAAFEAQFETSAVATALRTVMRHVLGPARYTATPDPHFGLAAPLYVHFTSPIRRYPDLVVHRLVKRFLRGERELEQAGLEDLCEGLNEASRRAAKAEAQRLYALTARLFTSRVGEIYPGNIVTVRPFGLVVQLIGTGVTGTVATRNLSRGPWRIDPATQALVSRAGGRHAVGESMRVRVTGADEALGRIELEPAPGR